MCAKGFDPFILIIATNSSLAAALNTDFARLSRDNRDALFSQSILRNSKA